MPLTRRELLKGLGLAVGGLGLSSAGYDRLIPFIHQPEDIVPGVATWYATSCRECPAGCGMIIRNREARVVKCEGNPEHPINRGKLCPRGQAAPYGLYDPDRIKGPQRGNGSGDFHSISWDDAISAVGSILAKKGRMAFVTDLQTGSLDTLMRAWMTALGGGPVVVYEPINYESIKAVSRGVVPTFNLRKADYIISFAADFLETWVSPVEFARQFAAVREPNNGHRTRFVYVGPRVSMTAANADLRIIVPPDFVGAVGYAIATEMGAAGAPARFTVDEVARRAGIDPSDIRKVARELSSAASPLAFPGGDINTARAAMAINTAKGNTAINFTRPHSVTNIASSAEMDSLISAMERGDIDVLIVHGSNPVYSLPEKSRFRDALKKVPNVISLSSFMDETTTNSHWVLPSNTPLESWGDYRPYPDVVNLLQPTMGTLFDTRQAGDILIQLARAAGVDPVATFKSDSYYGYLRTQWRVPLAANATASDVAPQWEGLVQLGGRWAGAPSPGLAIGIVPTASTAPTTPTAASTPPTIPPKMSDEIRLWAQPHIYFYDGRLANRRWLQEMPEPITKGVWGSWAEIAPSTAHRLGVTTGDLIEISRSGATITVPVLVSGGMAPNTVSVPIGEGHTAYGRYAKDIGANVWPLVDIELPTVTIHKTGKNEVVTRKKGATGQYDRNIVQTVVLGEPVRRGHIDMPTKKGYTFKDFYPGHDHSRHRWAMVIDLNRCIGCHACVVACYAENNVAVVGAEQVNRRRDMEWLRIDPYIDWKHKTAPVLFQPMLCQHCDSAPCETVCPVYAASHSDDGINMQIYNRCIGTRYCSNNCPYKVRRFNWYDYKWPEPLNYQLNPDVTVRSRGVMEKCTFCVQRIREVEIKARSERRPIRDGEVTPACVQTCPTGVFTFGNLMDPKSRISRLIKEDPRAYQVLQEPLNTKPAVIYLKRVVDRA